MANLLTFTYLRDLQKKERESRKLEKLNPDFYQALSEFISRKNTGDAGGAEKKEFESAVPVIRYILDRREQKVLEAAILSVRAGIKPENILPEEGVLFTSACDILAKHKVKTDEVFGIRPAPATENSAPKEEPASVQGAPETNGVAQAQAAEKKPEENSPNPAGLVKIKVLKDIPAFIAEDILTHGPWGKDDAVECPPKAAAILVENGFAEYN